jgi:hypothetical protein
LFSPPNVGIGIELNDTFEYSNWQRETDFIALFAYHLNEQIFQGFAKPEWDADCLC